MHPIDKYFQTKKLDNLFDVAWCFDNNKKEEDKQFRVDCMRGLDLINTESENKRGKRKQEKVNTLPLKFLEVVVKIYMKSIQTHKRKTMT